MEKIRVSDITMKQLAKQGDHSLSFKGKLEISKLLDKLAVSVIEIEGIRSARADALRVASSAMNSTSSVLSAQARSVLSILASMASGFLRDRYSICTVLTGAATWSRGCFAGLRASQVCSTLSSFSSTCTARTLFFTAEAMDFTRSASALPF